MRPSRPLKRPRPPAEQRLLAVLDRLLGDSMGGGPLLARFARGRPPHRQALLILVLYVATWAAAEALARLLAIGPHVKLVSLLTWGGAYIVVRSYIAAHTTRQIKATVEQDILPYASPGLLDAVAADLERRLTPMARIVRPILVASLCAAAGSLAFARQLGVSRSQALAPEPLFGIVIFFLSFVISARSAGAAGFYMSFAERLKTEPSGNFFVLGAAASPLVEGLAKLASQVLIFWALIFLAILSSMTLALPWPCGFAFERNSPFLIVFIPVAGFVTLGMGSLVYLRSEAKIRSALRSFTQRQAALLQQRINALLDPLDGRVPAESAEISQLTEWHDRILAGGRYGSRLGTAVSIALPFLLPAISVVSTLAKKLGVE